MTFKNLYVFAIICTCLFNEIKVKVPSKIKIVDTVVKINEKYRQNIRDKINRMFKSEKVLKMITRRAKLYLPVIEKILKDNGIPKDLKYIMILESGCKSDVVTNEEDIGFWQFRPITSKCVKLIVNDKVDERMHIEQSTYGFIRYIKDNYSVLGSWFWAVVAHNRGLGGTKKYIRNNKINKKKKTIQLHQCPSYIYQLIVYKLVLGKCIKKTKKTKIKLTFRNFNGMHIDDICKECNISRDTFKYFNRWLKIDVVPVDTRCRVVIPIK